MADLVSRATRLAMAVGAVLMVPACGSDRADDTANALDDANLMLEEPANDQSAMEAAANATDLEPVANVGDTAEDGGVLGETEGGDTGGNTVENNVTGM